MLYNNVVSSYTLIAMQVKAGEGSGWQKSKTVIISCHNNVVSTFIAMQVKAGESSGWQKSKTVIT